MRSLAAEQRQPLAIGGAYPQPPTAGQLLPGRPGTVGLHTISPGMVLTNLLLEGSTFANRQVGTSAIFSWTIACHLSFTERYDVLVCQCPRYTGADTSIGHQTTSGRFLSGYKNLHNLLLVPNSDGNFLCHDHISLSSGNTSLSA